jgi:protein HIRA/HIR1
MIALGDKKGFITIWFSGMTKPVFKMQISETKHTITDMSWSRCGHILLVTCLDGFMAAIKFEEGDLPTAPLTAEQTNAYFKGKFGVARGGATVSDGKDMLVQSALQMRLEEENRAEK